MVCICSALEPNFSFSKLRPPFNSCTVPRKVLLEKYEEGPDFNEFSFEEENDQHNVLDNPESLAPFPDVTNSRKYNESNSSAIQHRPAENGAHNSTYSGAYS